MKCGFLLSCAVPNKHRTEGEDVIQGSALDVMFQHRVRKCPSFFVKHEMPISFSVNCERIVLFSVKRNPDPPPPAP